MSTDQEILVTGIKVVDLLAPYTKGGKIGESAMKFFPLRNNAVIDTTTCLRSWPFFL